MSELGSDTCAGSDDGSRDSREDYWFEHNAAAGQVTLLVPIPQSAQVI